MRGDRDRAAARGGAPRGRDARVGPDDVLVRSHTAGVCRTDIEFLRGELSPRWVRYRCIPGHEWSGTVTEVGANVRDFAPGDPVVCEGVIPCDRCRRCRRGETNLCENYDQLGFTRGGGWGGARPRAAARRPRAAGQRLLRGRGPRRARILRSARARARSSRGGRGGRRPRNRHARLDRDPLAKLFGARTVVAYGIRSEELDFAKRVGAEHAVNVAKVDAAEETRRLLGKGLDVVVETAGAAPAVEAATRLVRQGGRVVLEGIAGEGRMLELPADHFVNQDMEVIGVVSYTSAVWTRMLALVAEGLLDLEPIVTHRFPAREFEDAFALMDNPEGRVTKILLEHVP